MKRGLVLSEVEGFTLIGILVTISLLALVTLIGLPNLRKFNIDQGVENSVSDFVQVIRKAQSNAQSRIKCPDNRTSVNWSVKIQDSSHYQLNVTCLNSDNSSNLILVNTYILPSSLSFDSSTGSSVTFNNIENNVCLLPPSATTCGTATNLTISLKNGSQTIRVKINQGGVINVVSG